MQTPEQLVPDVEQTGDRLVFSVRSRSGGTPRRVEMERRYGMGECDCEDFRYNKNYDCWHIQRVNKFLAITLVQSIAAK